LLASSPLSARREHDGSPRYVAFLLRGIRCRRAAVGRTVVDYGGEHPRWHRASELSCGPPSLGSALNRFLCPLRGSVLERCRCPVSGACTAPARVIQIGLPSHIMGRHCRMTMR
jgi:hypothetical protein